jgi:hypothetical protein
VTFERAVREVRRYPRRSPWTFGYLCVLLLTHAWVTLAPQVGNGAAVLLEVSTNLDNLRRHAVSSLLGSALFFDGTLTDVTSLDFAGTVITLGLGVVWCLGWLERQWGALRAFGVFLAGHIGATLITAVVIVVALGHGWYTPDVRHAVDYGISYGAETVLALTTGFLPRRYRVPWAVFVVAWPVLGGDWSGPLPDFTTVGHLVAATMGFALALGGARRRQRRGAPPRPVRIRRGSGV